MTARRHNGLDEREYPESKKRLLVLKYETETKKQQRQIRTLTDPREKVALASFKMICHWSTQEASVRL